MSPRVCAASKMSKQHKVHRIKTWLVRKEMWTQMHKGLTCSQHEGPWQGTEKQPSFRCPDRKGHSESQPLPAECEQRPCAAPHAQRAPPPTQRAPPHATASSAPRTASSAPRTASSPAAEAWAELAAGFWGRLCPVHRAVSWALSVKLAKLTQLGA